MNIDDNENFHVLDALRGAASIVVAVAHAWQVFLYPYSGDSVAFAVLGGAATWSVAVFFLLSGMLIAMSIQKRLVGRFSLASYVLARCFRIFPPLIAAVIITVGVVLLIRGFNLYGAESYWLPGDVAAARDKATFGWGQIPATLLLTYKLIPLDRFENFLIFNGPLWSLSFEFWLYMLVGLGASAIFNRSVGSMIAFLVLAYLIFFASNASEPPFVSVAVVWFWGVVLGWVGVEGRRRFLSWRQALCGCAIVVGVILGGRETLTYLKAPYHDGYQHVFYWMGALILSTIICSSLRRENFGPLMRIFRWSAGFSYTLYLVHFPLFMLSLSLFRPSLFSMGISGAILLSVASLLLVIAFSSALAKVVESRAWLPTVSTHLISILVRTINRRPKSF